MGDARALTRVALVVLTCTLGLAFPPLAAAVPTVPAATPSAFNTTPDCPVSATDTLCAWNVPVDPGNLFSALDYGECPYWAVEKYPALVQDALSADPLSGDWNGGSWLEHAQQEGLATSDVPAAGDLAVWQSVPSDPSGHVAYVEAVEGGAVIVSQMDGESIAPLPALQGSTEYLSAASLASFSQAYGLEYIVTGDSPSTPLSDVEQPAPTAPVTIAVTPTVSPTTPTTTPSPPASQRPVPVPAPTITPATKRRIIRKHSVRKHSVRKHSVRKHTVTKHPAKQHPAKPRNARR